MQCEPGDARAGATSSEPPEDANIQGFEHVLNFLYYCAYASSDRSNPCQQPEKLTSFTRGPLAGLQEQPRREGHVVVGIYFGWYGANIDPLWPVAQQISVYSRGTEADRVGSAHIIQNDLTALSAAAHPSPRSSDHEPLFILAGHSFGGRLLEQAITRPLEQRITAQLNSPDHSVPNFADLILFINPAARAHNAIDLFNFLGQNRVRYETTATDEHKPEPLLASITTPADAATGVLFTVAYAIPSMAEPGTTALTCFDPATNSTFPESESTPVLYRNTLPHLKEFQSHTFNEQRNEQRNLRTQCVDNKPNSFAYAIPNHCYFVEPPPNRWNGTPYWIISTDQHVIPDHGTIFTNRLLNLIAQFLPDDRDKATVTRH